MKKYILFNILIQIMILIISINNYFDKSNIKLLISLFLIYLIFSLEIIEYIFKIKINKYIHYFTTIIIFLLFLFILVK